MKKCSPEMHQFELTDPVHMKILEINKNKSEKSLVP